MQVGVGADKGALRQPSGHIVDIIAAVSNSGSLHVEIGACHTTGVLTNCKIKQYTAQYTVHSTWQGGAFWQDGR